MAVAPQVLRRKILPKGLMRANVFCGAGVFGLDEKAIPHAGAGEAIVKVSLASICATDLQIVRGNCPARAGLTLGHEGVGVISEIGQPVNGFQVGDRVLISAVAPLRTLRALPLGSAVETTGVRYRVAIGAHHRRRPGRVCSDPLRRIKPHRHSGQSCG